MLFHFKRRPVRVLIIQWWAYNVEARRLGFTPQIQIQIVQPHKNPIIFPSSPWVIIVPKIASRSSHAQKLIYQNRCRRVEPTRWQVFTVSVLLCVTILTCVYVFWRRRRNNLICFVESHTRILVWLAGMALNCPHFRFLPTVVTRK